MLTYKCDRCEAQFKHLVDGPVTHFIEGGLVSKDKSEYTTGLAVSITGASPNCIYLHKQLCKNCGKDLLNWLKRRRKMITKEKFIAAIVPTNEEYLRVCLVEKKNPQQRKYICSNFQEILRKKCKTKTKEEVLASLKEEMWETALEEIKPQTMKDYSILEAKDYSFLGTFILTSSTEE